MNSNRNRFACEESVRQGGFHASEELLPAVYTELRRLAASKLAREAPGQTLQATALVHEAWLKIARNGNRDWAGRTHFFAAAAEAMRCILIDRARRKRAARHGGNLKAVELNDDLIAASAAGEYLLPVHEALDKLAVHDPVKAELVKLRYFVGLTIEEAAHALGISEPNAKRYWAYARAWLYREIRAGRGNLFPIR